MKNMNDNADTIETAELDKVVADVLNYDNMMNESSRNEENGYIWVLCTCIMFLGEYKFFWNR